MVKSPIDRFKFGLKYTSDGFCPTEENYNKEVLLHILPGEKTTYMIDSLQIKCNRKYGNKSEICFYASLINGKNADVNILDNSACTELLLPKTIATNNPIKNNFYVYPNPVSDKIYIKRTSFNEQQSYAVHNLQNKLITKIRSHSPVTEIDVSDWPKGVYLLQIMDGEEMLVKKIIVK